jgi:hypothetical protein
MDIKTVKSSGRPTLEKPSPRDVHVQLHTESQQRLFYRLGDGNISKGIRKAADLINDALKGVF